jgi:hypothetical protein
MLLWNALLVDTGYNQARILSSSHVNKTFDLFFFDLVIENSLGGGNLAKFWSSLYIISKKVQIFRNFALHN